MKFKFLKIMFNLLRQQWIVGFTMITRTVIFCSLIFTTQLVSATVIGNPLISNGPKDGASTTYVSHESFGNSAINDSLISWGFYSSGDNDLKKLTPLLYELDSGNGYILRAIGATVTVTSNTLFDNLDFDTQVGDSTIYTSNYYFGWKDGSQTSYNTGVINYGTGSSYTMASLASNSSQNITGADIGTTLNFNNLLGDRLYSYKATTGVAPLVPVPAPGGILLLSLGFVLIAGLRLNR
jgi:hypothetical protein